MVEINRGHYRRPHSEYKDGPLPTNYKSGVLNLKQQSSNKTDPPNTENKQIKKQQINYNNHIKAHTRHRSQIIPRHGQT